MIFEIKSQFPPALVCTPHLLKGAKPLYNYRLCNTQENGDLRETKQELEESLSQRNGEGNSD